jgi:hypothetical protein
VLKKDPNHFSSKDLEFAGFGYTEAKSRYHQPSWEGAEFLGRWGGEGGHMMGREKPWPEPAYPYMSTGTWVLTLSLSFPLDECRPSSPLKFITSKVISRRSDGLSVSNCCVQ